MSYSESKYYNLLCRTQVAYIEKFNGEVSKYLMKETKLIEGMIDDYNQLKLEGRDDVAEDIKSAIEFSYVVYNNLYGF